MADNAKGNIIYHPHQIQFDGDVPENSEVAAKSQNSIYAVSYTHLDVYKRQEQEVFVKLLEQA